MRTILTCLALACASPVAANQISFDSTWDTQRFSLFSSNTYRFGGSALDILSEGSVSMAYRPVNEAQWNATQASWQWQVDQGVGATDLTLKGGDDRNIALYFVFLPEAEARAAAGGGNIRKLLTSESARVLVYVWGGDYSRGQKLDSPYLGPRGKTVALRPAGTGAFAENVNLSRDYAQSFGNAEGVLVGLAVSADSDDTDGEIRARLSQLRLQ